jgi:adenylate cyclase
MSKRIPILFGFILVALAIWLLITPIKNIQLVIERLENLGYDLQLRTRVLTDTKHHQSPVAIIDIDDQSLKALGRWPWSRGQLATLTNELAKEGAAVIAFDIFFSEAEKNMAESVMQKLRANQRLTPDIAAGLTKELALFNDDKVFAQSLAATPSVLALGFLPRQQEQNQLPPPLLTLASSEQKELQIIKAFGYISNIPLLQQAAKHGGFINIFPDSDGIIRHAALLIRYGNNVYPSLALQAVLTFLNADIKLITPFYGDSRRLEGIQLDSYVIPTDAKGQVLIPFIGKSYTFPYYSALDVLNHKLPKDALLGKILFVGTSATGLGDLQATAIQNPFPGVEIQATLVNGMLEKNFSYKPAWTYGANLFLTALLGIISAIFFPFLGPRSLVLIVIVVPPSLLFLNNWIWHETGLIMSFLIPALIVLSLAIMNIIYGYLFESRRRERLKNMFGQYVPAKHIDEMLKTSSDYALHGEDRDMTVLFADIRNFTSISEGMPASELVEMLNTFFTPMTEVIFKHRGTIDKYVGDLIMAFWGAPLQDRFHARHALYAALEMRTKIKELQSILSERNWPPIQVGIGINSGLMSVGDMGSRFRRNYTVLGDAVNLASRVEGLTKFYGVDIIVTQYTIHHQNRFIFRKLDHVRVKGKKYGIDIYELIGRITELTSELEQELELYHKALDYYFLQKWDDAEVLMDQLHQAYPDSHLYKIYLRRIKEFKENPLPPDWDGVYVHAVK